MFSRSAGIFAIGVSTSIDGGESQTYFCAGRRREYGLKEESYDGQVFGRGEMLFVLSLAPLRGPR